MTKKTKHKRGFGILDAKTREELETLLIDLDTELLHDYNRTDLKHVAVNGWRGIKSYTDKELVSYLADMYGCDEPDVFEEGDLTVELYRRARFELEMAKTLTGRR